MAAGSLAGGGGVLPAGGMLAGGGGSSVASGAEDDMFKQRAQAYLPPGFHTHFLDFVGTQTDVGTSGFAPTSAEALVVAGRAGGNKLRRTASGASGFHYQYGAGQGPAGIGSICVGNILWDPWYVEGSINLETFTGNSEIHIAGLSTIAGNVVVQNNTDAGGSYLALTLSNAISSGFLVLRSVQAGTLVTVVTTIPMEFNIDRRYGLGTFGLGNLYTSRDGVIFDIIPMPFGQPPGPAGLYCAERANGSALSYKCDWYGSAGVSL